MTPHMEEELQENIQREILGVPQEELRVNFNPLKQYRVCVREKGHHFQHVWVSLFYCFYRVILVLYWENLAVLGSESCNFCKKPGSDSCIQLYQWMHCVTSMTPFGHKISMFQLKIVTTIRMFYQFNIIVMLWARIPSFGSPNSWRQYIILTFHYHTILKDRGGWVFQHI
jgi:hypothetical protein